MLVEEEEVPVTDDVPDEAGVEEYEVTTMVVYGCPSLVGVIVTTEVATVSDSEVDGASVVEAAEVDVVVGSAVVEVGVLDVEVVGAAVDVGVVEVGVVDVGVDVGVLDVDVLGVEVEESEDVEEDVVSEEEEAEDVVVAAAEELLVVAALLAEELVGALEDETSAAEAEAELVLANELDASAEDVADSEV